MDKVTIVVFDKLKKGNNYENIRIIDNDKNNRDHKLLVMNYRVCKKKNNNNTPNFLL